SIRSARASGPPKRRQRTSRDSIRDRSGDGLDDVRGLAAWCNVPDRPGKTFADSMVVGINAIDVTAHVRHAKRRGALDLPLDRRRQSTQPRLPGHAEPAVRPLIGNLSPPDRRRETEEELTTATGPTPATPSRPRGRAQRSLFEAVTLLRIRVRVDDIPVLTPDDELLARHRRQGSDPLRSVRGSHLEARRGEQLLGAGRLFPARCGAPGNGEDRREEHNEASAATVIESA